MRYSILITLNFCLVLSTLFAQTRGMKVFAYDPTSGEQVPLYSESWAVLIGINKYKHVDPLNYAVADAEAMRKLLISEFQFNPERMILITDDQATKAGILNAFGKLLDTSPTDRVIIFYAGHGTQIDLPSGGEMGYLVPIEGKIKTRSDLYNTCVSMEELKNISKQIPAKHVLFLVDACYGGLAAVTSRALSRETQLYLQKISNARARQIITAGGRGEFAYESAEWGHSAFTKSLLEGLEKKLADLDGNGLVTATELSSYLKPRVSAASEQKQTPQFKSFTDDEGDFVFVVSVPEYSLTIKSLPAKNTVYLSGKKISENKEMVKQSFRQGSYTVEIEAPGRERYSTTVELTEDRELTPRMIATTIMYMLETNPTGASVKIDGVDAGQTPLRTELTIGQHRFELSKENYEALSFVSDVSEKKTYEKKDLNLLLYEISVVSNPRGAQIFLNDLPQGTAPATVPVRPGSKYTLELQYEGQKLSTSFQPAGSGAVTADFKTGQVQYAGPTVQPATTEVTPKKEEKELEVPAAFLEIAISPIDAEIKVDGKTVSATRGIAKTEVRPGRRVILVSKSGYESDQSTVDVYPGDTKRINVKLSQVSSSSSWLYYVAGGAVLAGGAAAYFLLAKKPGEEEDRYGKPPGFPTSP